MTPRHRLAAPMGPDMMGQQAPMPLSMPPLQFAPPPPISPDATGASAIGGLTNLAMALGGKIGNRQPNSKATDAPMPRRKTPLAEMGQQEPNYA